MHDPPPVANAGLGLDLLGRPGSSDLRPSIVAAAHVGVARPSPRGPADRNQSRAAPRPVVQGMRRSIIFSTLVIGAVQRGLRAGRQDPLPRRLHVVLGPGTRVVGRCQEGGQGARREPRRRQASGWTAAADVRWAAAVHVRRGGRRQARGRSVRRRLPGHALRVGGGPAERRLVVVRLERQPLWRRL
jgi:hypothetical protein